MSEEKPKGVLDGLPQMIEKMKKANAEGPEPRMSDDEVERIATQFHKTLSATKAHIETVKAKGGPTATMDAAKVLMEGLHNAMREAGADLPPFSMVDPGEPRGPERNGRAVVTDILDDATLRDGPVEVLVERYLDTVVAAHHAIERGRVARHNRFVVRSLKIQKALKARVPDGRTALLPFLSDPDPNIRSSVALACRDIAPEQAEAILASARLR